MKRDFFGLFWPAYIDAFTEANIASGWRKTGLFPFNSELVTLQLAKPLKVDISRPVSNQSSGSSALSQINVREVRNLVYAVANEVIYKLDSKEQRKLENTILHLQNKVTWLQRKNKDLQASANHKKKKHKRKKKVIEQFRAEEGNGAVFLSPSKIQRFRDIDDAREQARVDEQAAKQLAKEQQQQAKITKQEDTKQRQQQRQQQREEREVAQAAAKAAKEVVKEASNASRQLNNDLQLSTKKPKRQQHLLSIPQLQPVSQNIEVVAGPSNPALQRPSRTKRAPAYLDGYQLD